MYKFCILGDDERSNFIRKMYKEEKKEIVSYDKADFIITSIPFSRDGKYVNGDKILIDDFMKNIKGKYLFSGVIPKEVVENMDKTKVYDLIKLDEVAILNSIPTSEGAIFEAMKNSNITICNSNSLVLGYGRIGKTLTKMLSGIGANVFAEARNKKDLSLISSNGYNRVKLEELEEYLPKMDFIFNTIPNCILNEERLKLLKENTLVVDLASNPGGVDFVNAKKLGIDVIWSLGIPSKIAPKSAAMYIKDTIDSIITNSIEKV